MVNFFLNGFNLIFFNFYEFENYLDSNKNYSILNYHSNLVYFYGNVKFIIYFISVD
jgi:hypothetical protein